jgi:integrase
MARKSATTSAHRLTAASVAALPPTGTRYVVRDTTLAGFSVVVGSSGTKSFMIDFRVSRDRTKRRMALGRFPTVLPDAARRQAAVVKADATLRGTDAAKERRARAVTEQQARAATRARRRVDQTAASKTMQELSVRFLEDAALRVRASTLALYSSLLKIHILPTLGGRRVADISTARLTTLHASMAATPTTANQSVRLLSTMFNFAERLGEVPRGSNPATHVVRFRESLKERYLQPSEVAAILAALDRAETVGLSPAPWQQRPISALTQKHAPPPTCGKKNRARGEAIPAHPLAVAALRLLILTGARKQEILTLRWTDVDLSRGMLMLSDSKTGSSVRPLSPLARDILRALHTDAYSPFVFASRADPARPIRDVTHLWDAVRHATGLVSVRLHDLRHTAASLMLQHGASLAEVGRAIGHTSARTTSRYAHIADAGAQRAADLLGGAIDALQSAKKASKNG